MGWYHQRRACWARVEDGLKLNSISCVQILQCVSSPLAHLTDPIENLWSIIKREVYKEGKRYTCLDSVWEAVAAAAHNVGREQIKKLTESMDGRLLSVLMKKGGYIGH